MKLSKTDFLIYRACAHNAWVKLHRPEIFRAQPLSAFERNIIETGNAVDDLARGLFAGGITVARDAFAQTRELIAARQPVIYQAAVATDRFVIASDMLVWNDATSVYDLYEVKASTSGDDRRAKDKLYTDDLGFQAAVLRAAGVPLGRQYLVRLDAGYVRGARLDLDALFTKDDFSERVGAISDPLETEMATAHEVLQRTAPLPGPCACIYKGRSAHCTTFAFSNPDVPAYSVHDLARIGSAPARLHALIDRGILAISDVPDDAELSGTQRNQVHAAKTQRQIIDHAALARLLDSYQFPLAFFDYETYAAGVPRFAGYRPFDHIPFQFSLDIVDRADAEIVHDELLYTEAGCPDAVVIDALQRMLPPTGSIVTWNKSFEMTINRRLAERNPAARAFLEAVNARIVDLMDVVSSQALIDPGFKGSSSIKAVLPVLVPQLSYGALAIQDGGSASDTWNRIVTGHDTASEIVAKRRSLLTYCALDTRAMWEIWRVLRRILRD